MDIGESVSSFFIARSSALMEEKQRYFPGIAEALFQGSTRLAQLAHARLSALKSHLGVRMNAAERFARLLVLQREAFEAEMQGRLRRADFFWREFHDVLRASWDDMAMWGAAAAAEREAQLAEPTDQQYRQRLLDEIFIDVHLAFYNGRAAHPESLTWNDRAFEHANYAVGLAELAGYAPEAMKHIIATPCELQIELCRAAGKFPQALKVCRQLAARFPTRLPFQQRLAALHFEGAMLRLNNAGDTASDAADARQLDAALRELELDRALYPGSADLYTVASQLQLIRSVKLANSNQTADALVAVKWAHAYLPDQQETSDIEARLTANMHMLKKQSDQLQLQLRQSANATLTEEGKKLVAEAERGFMPAVGVENSARAAEIRRLGIQARQAGGDDAANDGGWHVGDEDVPLLNAGAAAGRDGEPFGWWLLSRRDLAVKAVCVAACCVLTYAALSAHTQGGIQATRNAAYADLQQAVLKGDDNALISSAESFLGAPAWGSDGREALVWQRYEQAFVRWFAAQGSALDDPGRLRVERFRRLSGTGKKSTEVAK